MSVYIALLRGAGGSADPCSPLGSPSAAEGLRKVLSYIGFKRIRTYGPSGDAAFDAVDNSRRKMEAEIGYELRHSAGGSLGVVLMTLDELRFAAASHPLADRGPTERLFVTVLGHEPSREDLSLLLETMNGVDEHEVVGSAVFSYYGAGYESSRRSNAFIEKVLKAPATTRPWSFMAGLLELAADERGPTWIAAREPDA